MDSPDASSLTPPAQAIASYTRASAFSSYTPGRATAPQTYTKMELSFDSVFFSSAFPVSRSISFASVSRFPESSSDSVVASRRSSSSRFSCFFEHPALQHNPTLRNKITDTCFHIFLTFISSPYDITAVSPFMSDANIVSNCKIKYNSYLQFCYGFVISISIEKSQFLPVQAQAPLLFASPAALFPRQKDQATQLSMLRPTGQSQSKVPLWQVREPPCSL